MEAEGDDTIIETTYTPLHAHDTYGSIGDSILRIPEYVSKAKELGLTSLGLTNHGSLSTFVNFYEECTNNNIKPIIGCEFYLVENKLIKDKEHKHCNHIILLAKNNDGLRNLILIHNDAYREGFYYRPRTDLNTIEKYSDNLICLTACIASPLNNPDKEKRKQILLRLLSIFHDDLYLEIQPGHFKEQIEYNDILVQLSQKYNVKLTATNDIHYLNKEDAKIHDYHVKESRKMQIMSTMIYPDIIYYLMNREELSTNFVITEYLNQDIINEAIDNTNLIASKCNVTLDTKQIMPHYSLKIDEDKVLRDLCYKELNSQHLSNEYKARLDYELNVIKTLGFSGYFLIVKDMIDFCDRNGIARGPGRGSAAGSLVSYLLNISIADPIKYNLMFERFLSVNRKALPDIDTDLAPDKRPEVYQHIIDKYGKDNCCFISTFNIRKARNAIKASCRLLGYNTDIANKISKKIPYINYDDEGEKHVNISVQEAFRTIEDFRKIAKSYPDVVKLADKLEGYPSSTGIHPAGIVIAPFNVNECYPLINCNNNLLMATSLDLKDVEKLSGVKFDLLALSSLKAIDKTLKEVGVTFNYSDTALLSDSKVWDLIGSSNTTGLFQISSNTYKTRMPLLKPKSIPELANCLALVRGPCISSGADKKYVQILHKELEPEIIHDVYWKATKDTYGIVIYQEQILKICMNIGFDSETAYNILKAVSKKKIDKINNYKQDFYRLGKNKKINIEALDKIWSEIVGAGLYAFNTAHAVSYALVCYCSAWLKTYYPLQYMKNLLSIQYDKSLDKDSIITILFECKRLGIEFLLPDLVKSQWEFTIEDSKIRIGFCAIKGIGENAYLAIKDKINAGLAGIDFVKEAQDRVINKKVMQILIAANMFGDIYTTAEYYMTTVRKEKDWDYIIKLGNKNYNLYNTNDFSEELFGSDLFLN